MPKILIVFQLFFFYCASLGATQKVVIGTGNVNGIYYPSGQAICHILREHLSDVQCEVRESTGSVANLESLADHKVNFAISQLDWQHHAYNGTSQFIIRGGNKHLRAVINLYEEPFTVITRAGCNIRNFDDLKGKRISIGNLGSGQRGTTEILMRAKGWTMADFSKVYAFNQMEQANALCDNVIDAFTLTVGHPNREIQQLAKRCDIRLVSMTGPVVERLIRNSNYYHSAEILGGIYRNNPKAIKTFSMHTGLVTLANVDNQLVYKVTAALVKHLDELRTLTPIFDQVDVAEMTHDLALPLHSGAERFFAEKSTNASDRLL